jgi:hypothetical protein
VCIRYVGDRVIVKGKNNYSIGVATMMKIEYLPAFVIGPCKPYYNIGPGTIVRISEYNTLVRYDDFGPLWTDSQNVSNIIILCA